MADNLKGIGDSLRDVLKDPGAADRKRKAEQDRILREQAAKRKAEAEAMRKPPVRKSLDKATSQVRAKANAPASSATLRKLQPGSWENNVQKARVGLGIKEGSADDQLLKSALWVYMTDLGVEAKGEVDERVPLPALTPAQYNAFIKDFRGQEEKWFQKVRERRAIRAQNQAAPRLAPSDGIAMDEARQQRFLETPLFGRESLSIADMERMTDTAAGNIEEFIKGVVPGPQPVKDAVAGIGSGVLMAFPRLSQQIATAVEGSGELIRSAQEGRESMVDPSLPIGAGTEAAFTIGTSLLGGGLLNSGLKSIGVLPKVAKRVGKLSQAVKTEPEAVVRAMVDEGVEAQEAVQVVEQLRNAPEEEINSLLANLPDGVASTGRVTEDGRPIVSAKAGSRVQPEVSPQADNLADPVTLSADDVPQTPQAQPKIDITEPRVPESTGLTQAETALYRAGMDVQQYVKTPKPIGKLLEEAEGVNGLNVAREVAKSGRNVSDVEQAAMLRSYHQNVAQREDLVRQYNAATDVNDQARIKTQIDLLTEDATTILDASDKAGTAWGRSGRARQLEIAGSKDPAVMQYRWSSRMGDVTPEAQGAIQRVTEAETKLDEALARIAKLEEDAANRAMGVTAPARSGRAKVNYTRKVSKTDYESALKTWQSGGVKQSKTRGAVIRISEEQWKALKTMARYHIESGIENAAEVANRILEITGDAVDRVTVLRAIKESAVDDARALNMGRMEGEEFLARGANAIESPEIRKLRFAADRRKAEFDALLREAEKKAEFEQANWAKKSASLLSETIGTTRAILSSGDLSAPFRQGLVMLVAKPKLAGKAFHNMFKSFRKKGYEEAMWQITQMPRYNEMVSGKLALTDAGSGLLPREEAFISNILERIPGVSKVAQFWTGWSEQTYTAFLNTLRADAFSQYVDVLEDAGVKLSRADLENIALWVNTATGRGNLGKLENSADLGAKLFFSPRFLKSRFDMATALPIRNLANQEVSAAVRATIAKDYARVMAVMGTTLGLATLAGMHEGDPRSSRFGKIDLGNVLFDATGGIAGMQTYLSRMAAWLSTSVPGMEETPIRKSWAGKYSGKDARFAGGVEMTTNFILGKSSPPVRAIAYGAQGKDFKGDPTSIGQEFAKQLVPIGFQNVQSNIQSGMKPNDVLLSFILDFFGLGTSSDMPDKGK